MSGWLRRLRAGAVVALVFGAAWGTTIQLALIVSRILDFRFTGPGATVEFWLMTYATFVGIGFVHGMLFSLLLGMAGRDRTVDTFPRWLGALIGGMVAAAGAVLIGVTTVGGGWPLVGMISAIGALSTTGLLTIARRGALPSSPVEPKKIGS